MTGIRPLASATPPAACGPALLAAVLAALALPRLQPGAHAQTPSAPDTARTRLVEIIATDSLTGGFEDGERVERLIGNVRLRQDATWLEADRVTRYVDRDEILFVGNVRIIDEGDTLTAERVLYDRRTKVGRATGDVRLSDGDVEVFAPSGLYFVDEKRAAFDERVRLVDSTSVLTSRTGQYWTEEKRARFAGDVRLLQERTQMDADSLSYLREEEVAHAWGNVRIERYGDGDAASEADSSTVTLLFGQEAYNDEKQGFSRITGAPLLVQIRADSAGTGPDTLLVRATVLETQRLDSLQRLTATAGVRVLRGELAAVSDSLVYERVEVEGAPVEEDIRLFREPVAWFEASQVHGDTIRVAARDGAIDSLFVRGSAFVAQQDTLLERINQLRGRRLVGVFEQDSLRRMFVGPNAEVIRFQRTEQGEADGAVQASADSVAAHFRDNELHRFDAYSGIDGTLYPEDLLPDQLQLEGFRWTPERRPDRAALLEGQRLEPGPPEEDPPAAEPEPASAALRAGQSLTERPEDERNE